MSQSPVLAIVIPNYNYEKFVRRAIDSVLDQHSKHVELVVVDDGSTDGSWSIISRYKDLKRIKIPNGGSLRACICGLEMTSAPFVLFLDADDELKPGSLRRIIREIGPGVSKLQFALTRVDSDGVPIGGSPALDDYRDSERLKRQVLSKGVYRSPPTSGNVFRRDLCQYLYEAEYDRAVDGIILYIAPFFGDVVSISESLGIYRVHGKNLSSIGNGLNLPHMRRELKRFRCQMQHLNEILFKIGYGKDRVDHDSQFVIKEKLFQITIVEGKKPTLAFIIDFIGHVSTERINLKQKMGFYFLAVSSLFVGNARMLRMISYRLRPGARSASGLLKSMLSARPAT